MIQRRNKSDSYAFIAVILFLFYSFYWSLFQKSNSIISSLLIGLSFLFGILSILSDKKTVNISKRLLRFMSGWMLIIILFLFFRNWWGVTSTIKWCWSIFIVFCICQNTQRLTDIYKAVTIIGFPHVIATIFFFAFRNLYTVMYTVFGYWPSGTRNGKYGFKAGISNHYSLNGIYIAIVFLCCFAYTFYLYKKHEKKTFIFGTISIITLLSLILTMKRAHLMFSISAILLGIIFFARKISGRKFVNVILILLLIIGIFLWAYQKFPEIGMALERFEDIDAEEGSLGKRIDMWKYALNIFSEHPFIGIGWSGFKATSGYGMNAHNVYIQLLAETGILGFNIYMFTLILLVINLIRGCKINIMRDCYDDFYFSSFASLLICFFYILYSLSGNCLFDTTFNFFIFTIATTYYLIQPKAREVSVYDNVPDNIDSNPTLNLTV